MTDIGNLHDLLTSGTASAGKEALTAAFDQMPANLAPTSLVDLASGLDVDMLGWVLFPAIASRLRKDKQFFQAIATLATKPGLGQGFYMVLLDFLDSAARKAGGKHKTKYFAVIRQVAQQVALPIEVQAKACKLLGRDGKSPETRAVVNALAQTGKAQLVAAVGHVIVTWIGMGIPVSPKLAGALTEWATANLRKSVRLPGVLRGIAALQNRPAAVKTLRAVITSAQQPQEWLAVLESIGGQLPDDLFANIVAKLVKTRADETLPIIRSLMAGGRLKMMLDRDPLVSLQWLRSIPEAVMSLELQSRLDQLKNSADRAVARAVRALSEKSPIGTTIDASLQSGVREPFTRSETSNPPLGAAFETGFQRADAMYRDLKLSNSLPLHNHWHAGLFNAFEGFPDGRGKLSGINVDRIRNVVHWFSAEGVYFNSTIGTLEAPIQRLRDEFLGAFEVEPVIQFHGVRTSSNGVTLDQRRAIINTAVDLIGKDIEWTYADMLDYRGTGWNGQISDIDELRCDGVVEFCYERQGIRVCGGKNPNNRNQWNISIAGKNHPENHNDMHNYGYNQGELCPRIQAGDQQNDTEFVRPLNPVPVIKAFLVIPGWMESKTPWVILKVEALFSDWVWGRLRVRQVGAPNFDFLVSEPDNFGRYSGAWRLQQLPANDALAIKWLGKRATGPRYTGSNLNFEFRLQIIDQGGNVGAEQSTEAVLSFS